MSARQTVPAPKVSSSTSAVEALTAGDERPPAGVVRLLSVRDAERLTERIRFQVESIDNGLFKLRNLLEEAKGSNAWSVLGHASWTAYLASLFEGRPMRLGSDERREITSYLSAEGMSTRAIAPIVGVSQKTVDREVRAARESDDSPAPSTEPASSGPVRPVEPVRGLDGKAYARKKPEPESKAAAEARERAEAEKAAAQEWAAWRDLYSGIVSSFMTLAGHSNSTPSKLFRQLEPGMLMPNQEREFTVERMRAAITTLEHLIEWKEAGQ